MTKILKTIAGAPDKPLIIGDIAIPCFVLENEKRVITQRGLFRALGMSVGSSGGRGGDRLVKFMEQSRFNEFSSNELRMMTSIPIKFKGATGSISFGYEATILVDICDMVIQANKAGVLLQSQLHIAERAETLFRGFAKTGIIALVDEATGYQYVRDKNALYKILEAYISPELLPWSKRFPDEFYKELFRLNNWSYNPVSVRRPGVIGSWTNKIIYERLPDGVLEELKRKTPKSEAGNRTARYFQSLTQDIGNPHLEKQILQVIPIMRLSSNMRKFWSNFARAFNVGQQELDLDNEE